MSSPIELKKPSLFVFNNSNNENSEYNGYNSNNNQPPPNSPKDAINKKENARILKGQYISTKFEKILPKGSTQSLNTIINSGTKIPDSTINFEGASSMAGLYKLSDGKSYIVRKTPIKDFQLQNRLSNELNCYKVLQTDNNSKKYISELVYADVLFAGGKNMSYFIFNYEPGMRLDTFIKENENSLSADDVLKIYEYLLQGIKFIGSKGIVHRDIKPQNIWFSLERNIPLIFDFDGSCMNESCSTVEFTGTPNYATPHSLSLRSSSPALNGFFSDSSVKEYNYTTTYDKYSALKVLENDLIKLVKPEEKDKIMERVAIDKENLDKENLDKENLDKENLDKENASHLSGHLSGGYTNCRIGVMNPRWGGAIQGILRGKSKIQTRKKSKPQNKLEAILGLSEIVIGGACACQAVPQLPTPLGGSRYKSRSDNYTHRRGGYKATKRNLKYLKLWKKGKSIGFTMRSSLKAKGLIPRSNGTKRISAKYRK
jgi:serine/threonine protein kinase